MRFAKFWWYQLSSCFHASTCSVRIFAPIWCWFGVFQGLISGAPCRLVRFDVVMLIFATHYGRFDEVVVASGEIPRSSYLESFILPSVSPFG